MKAIFKVLSSVNKLLLPKYSKRDFTSLSSIDKAIVAYRYWITKNSL
jgi:hypothetical protein